MTLEDQNSNTWVEGVKERKRGDLNRKSMRNLSFEQLRFLSMH